MGLPGSLNLLLEGSRDSPLHRQEEGLGSSGPSSTPHLQAVKHQASILQTGTGVAIPHQVPGVAKVLG